MLPDPQAASKAADAQVSASRMRRNRFPVIQISKGLLGVV
jgi:hypothetical protein